MTREWNRIITAAFCAVTFGQAWAQTTQFATLDIEWENVIIYADNLADRSKLATAPNAVNVNLRNFMPLITIGDIVSVNGRPASPTFANTDIIFSCRRPRIGGWHVLAYR